MQLLRIKQNEQSSLFILKIYFHLNISVLIGLVQASVDKGIEIVNYVKAI